MDIAPHLLSVFGAPHKVLMAHKSCVTGLQVVLSIKAWHKSL